MFLPVTHNGIISVLPEENAIPASPLPIEGLVPEKRIEQ